MPKAKNAGRRDQEINIKESIYVKFHRGGLCFHDMIEYVQKLRSGINEQVLGIHPQFLRRIAPQLTRSRN